MTPAQTQMPELKPCPFCGGTNIEAHAYGQNIGGEPDAFCQCNDCTTTGPNGKDKAEAITAWNRRALSQQADTAQEGLQELANDTLDALRKAQMFKLATRWSKFLAAPKQADTPAQAVAWAPESAQTVLNQDGEGPWGAYELQEVADLLNDAEKVRPNLIAVPAQHVPLIDEGNIEPAQQPETAQQEARKPDCGHGHVYPRADGIKARCGGPGLCMMCARDKELSDLPAHPKEPEA